MGSRAYVLRRECEYSGSFLSSRGEICEQTVIPKLELLPGGTRYAQPTNPAANFPRRIYCYAVTPTWVKSRRVQRALPAMNFTLLINSTFPARDL